MKDPNHVKDSLLYQIIRLNLKIRKILYMQKGKLNLYTNERSKCKTSNFMLTVGKNNIVTLAEGNQIKK